MGISDRWRSRSGHHEVYGQRTQSSPVTVRDKEVGIRSALRRLPSLESHLWNSPSRGRPPGDEWGWGSEFRSQYHVPTNGPVARHDIVSGSQTNARPARN